MAGISITLSVKDDGSVAIQKVAGELKKLEDVATRSVGGMQSTFESLKKNWLEVTAAIAGATITLKKAWDFATVAAEFEETTERLNKQLAKYNTSAGSLITTMKQLAGGQISMAESAKLASQGLAAGLNVEQIKKFTEISEIAADVMRESIPQAFEEMIKAMATGRGAVLKNIGIAIDLKNETDDLTDTIGAQADQLTQLEKVQERANLVMSQAPGVIKSLGGETASTADKMQAMEATVKDLTISIGFGLQAVVVSVIGTFQLAATFVMDLVSIFFKLASGVAFVTDAIGLTNSAFKKMSELSEAARLSADDLRQKGVEKLTLANEALKKMIDPLGSSMDKAKKHVKDLTDSHKDAAHATEEQIKAYENLVDTLKNKLVGSIKDAIKEQQNIVIASNQGLQKLATVNLDDKIKSLPNVSDQLHELKRAAFNLPFEGTGRTEGLQSIIATTEKLKGSTSESASQITLLQNKIDSLMNQPAPPSFGTLEQLKKFKSEAVANEEEISTLKEKMSTLQSVQVTPSDLDRFITLMRNDLGSALDANKTKAESTINVLENVLSNANASAEELVKSIKEIQKNKIIDIQITGISQALQDAMELDRVLNNVRIQSIPLMNAPISSITSSNIPASKPSIFDSVSSANNVSISANNISIPDPTPIWITTTGGVPLISNVPPLPSVGPPPETFGPGFAEGTSFVTQDMVAVVHKGEAIIPKEQNPFRGSLGFGAGFGDSFSLARLMGQGFAGSTSIFNVEKIEINSPSADPRELAKGIKTELNNLSRFA